MIRGLPASGWVFSAHAEVVLQPLIFRSVAEGILRARGGSSTPLNSNDAPGGYSPRTRR